jgi:hypothetical protein
MTDIEKLKKLMMEAEVPYFSDEDLQFWLDENKGDVYATAYQCLKIKAQNTSLNISGLSTADTTKYFLRLANTYRPRNSGTLIGG